MANKKPQFTDDELKLICEMVTENLEVRQQKLMIRKQNHLRTIKVGKRKMKEAEEEIERIQTIAEKLGASYVKSAKNAPGRPPNPPFSYTMEQLIVFSKMSLWLLDREVEFYQRIADVLLILSLLLFFIIPAVLVLANLKLETPVAQNAAFVIWLVISGASLWFVLFHRLSDFVSRKVSSVVPKLKMFLVGRLPICDVPCLINHSNLTVRTSAVGRLTGSVVDPE